MNYRSRPTPPSRSPVAPRSPVAFTLVELLVVIGIIALLISVLLPSLNKARDSANTVACLSNLRQLGQASLMFAGEKKGYLPSSSDQNIAITQDPSRLRYAWRTRNNALEMLDWASSLLPYMGARGQPDFQTAPGAQTKVFVCPSDQVTLDWSDSTSRGYTVYNNTTYNSASGGSIRISYGINVDVTANTLASTGVGYWNVGGEVFCFRYEGGAELKANSQGDKVQAQPLNGRLSRVHNPTRTLLFADCGTLPRVGTNPLDYSDALAYTTNYISYNTSDAILTANPTLKYTLAGVARTSWLGTRIPNDRHGKRGSSLRPAGATQAVLPPETNTKVKGGRINVAFCDGHAETVGYDDYKTVNVSPYAPK